MVILFSIIKKNKVELFNAMSFAFVAKTYLLGKIYKIYSSNLCLQLYIFVQTAYISYSDGVFF